VLYTIPFSIIWTCIYVKDIDSVVHSLLKIPSKCMSWARGHCSSRSSDGDFLRSFFILHCSLLIEYCCHLPLLYHLPILLPGIGFSTAGPSCSRRWNGCKSHFVQDLHRLV